MLLLEPIQVYEGDGVNPRWFGLFHGNGISHRGYDDAWGFDIDCGTTEGGGSGSDGDSNGNGIGIIDVLLSVDGDGCGDNSDQFGDGIGEGFEYPGLQE